MEKPHSERRRYERFELPCQVLVSDEQGRELLRTKALNISDGGMLIAARADQAIAIGETVQVAVEVPRGEKHEDFFSIASVVRHQPLEGGELGMALMFGKRVLLDLESNRPADSQ